MTSFDQGESGMHFLQKLPRQNSTALTSLCVQPEKVGCGLLRDAKL